MSEDKKEEIPIPRMDVIIKAYDNIDAVIEKQVNENEMSLMEVEIMFLMFRKKLDQDETLNLVDFYNSPHARDRPNVDFKNHNKMYG